MNYPAIIGAGIEPPQRLPREPESGFLGIRPPSNKDWLFTGKGEMFSETPPDIELEQLIEIIRELDPLFKNYIIQQIKNFANLHRQSKEKGQETAPKETNPAPKGRKPR
jgi:hypothetical protein